MSMNSWLRGILVCSAFVCALSFGTLAWLAVRTTGGERGVGTQAASTWKTIFPEGPGEHSGLEAVLDRAAADAARTVEELAARLRQLNSLPGVKSGELLLTFKSPASLRAFQEQAAARGLKILNADDRLLTARVGYDDAEAMARELRRQADNLDNVGLNYLAWVPGLPDMDRPDTANAGGTLPYGSSGLEAVGAGGNRTGWGKGSKVAVLDTGITPHSILNGTAMSHIDLVQDGQQPNGHGTAMASLIAGQDPANGGVAPASELLDIRVADTRGESNTALVADGIMRAVDEGAKVINISLGTTGDSVILRKAVAYAQERGVVVVAAAGNEQQAALAYPAGYEGVISVAAVDAAGNQAFFSNSGESLTISAPGVGIISAYDNNRMVISSGTSQATALTTGVVSTLLSRGYSPQSITTTLQKYARSTGAPRSQVGAGIVQVPTD